MSNRRHAMSAVTHTKNGYGNFTSADLEAMESRQIGLDLCCRERLWFWQCLVMLMG